MSTPTKEPIYNVEAIYLGQRTTLIGGYRHCFRTTKGELKYFSGLRGTLYFGDTYLMSKEGYIKTRPVRIDETSAKLQPTAKEITEFELHKEIVKDAKARKRKALELKKPHKDITRAIELLRPFVIYSDSYDLRRFTDYLNNQLSKKKRKK